MTTAAPSVVLVSAHGGSGASTLSAHLADAWHEVELAQAAVHGAEHAVVVASATVDGVVAATHAIRRLSGVTSAPTVHLALVRDGHGAAPLGARARVRALSVFVASVTEVPWVHRWRYEESAAHTPSAAYRGAVERLVAAVTPPPTSRPRTRAGRRQPLVSAAGSVS